MHAARLTERIALDREVRAPNGAGGDTIDWAEQFQAPAAFKYQRGKEAERAGGQTGTAVFKVALRSFPGSRSITTRDSLRDVRREVRYNIREVDAVTDRNWVWLVCESGVAV